MKKLCSCSTMNLSRKIGMCMLIILSSFIIAVTVSQGLQISQIKDSQEEAPKNFFNQFAGSSIEEMTNAIRRMISAVYDQRICFVMSLRSILQTSNSFSDISFRKEISKDFEINRTQCFLTKTNSIFNCEESEVFLEAFEEQWIIHRNQDLHRITIFFQNLNDTEDIQTLTISDGKLPYYNFSILNGTDVTEIISQVPENTSLFARSRKDPFIEDPKLYSFLYTTVLFQNYRILLEIQTNMGVMIESFRKVKYSDSSNLVMVWRNETDPKGYTLLSASNGLTPGINYAELLDSVLKEKRLENGSLFLAYTVPFSNVFPVNTKEIDYSNASNFRLSVIMHSISISETGERSVRHITNRMSLATQTFSIFQMVSTLIAIICISYSVSSKIEKVLRIATESIRKYIQNLSVYGWETEKNKKNKKIFEKKASQAYQIEDRLNLEIESQNNKTLSEKQKKEKNTMKKLTEKERNERFFEILQNLTEYNNSKDDFSNQILHNLYLTINSIEKKRKNTRLQSKIKYDWFPLNLFDTKFMEENRIQDDWRFNQLKQMIIEFHSKQNNSKNPENNKE